MAAKKKAKKAKKATKKKAAKEEEVIDLGQLDSSRLPLIIHSGRIR